MKPVEEIQSEIVTHPFTAEGVCESPESVVVPITGALCTILLALCGDDSKWRAGTMLGVKKENDTVPPAKWDRGYATRGEALKAGCIAAAKWFRKQKAEKPAKAVEAFAEKALAEGDTPAAKAPKLDLPPPAAGAEAPVDGEYRDLPVKACEPNPWNRKDDEPEEFAAFVASIRDEGLLEPIVVRPITSGELPAVADAAPRFQIIAGERRWRAFVALEKETIPARVLRNVDDGRAKVLTLVENLLRLNLNPVQEAEGYASLVSEGWTHDRIAGRVKRSRTRVTNTIRLLQLPADVLAFVRDGRLTPAHGEAILRFLPDGKTDAERDEAAPKWREILLQMAKFAVQQRVTAGQMMRGVPFVSELKAAGLVVLIDYFSEFKMTPTLKKHPAYFEHSGEEWVCLNPAHWEADVERRAEAKARQAEADRKAAEEEAAKSRGKKQLDLSTAPADSYVALTGASEAVKELVPADKRLIAKGAEGKVTVVTDVELGKRLMRAFMRAVKDNRKAGAESIAEKVRKKLGGLKKIGSREIAWLVASVGIADFRAVPLYVSEEACERAGVKLPKRPEGMDDLTYLAKCEPTDLVRVLIEYRLESALACLVENGPGGTGARLLRWWLDTDTLWLLEESEEGKAELLEQIKSAAWYQKALAGDAGAEGEE